eukprot:TRINITY_DN638_c0_g1_i1.p1 TRINITY_DN638_c0_g1~~TRINITY_DN638_c0_g1_i1.p1  ORF type:complete len:123 (-),score=8.55 TRINITY_DN638_c0_g1_i1:704-1072(-)
MLILRFLPKLEPFSCVKRVGTSPSMRLTPGSNLSRDSLLSAPSSLMRLDTTDVVKLASFVFTFSIVAATSACHCVQRMTMTANTQSQNPPDSLSRECILGHARKEYPRRMSGKDFKALTLNL